MRKNVVRNTQARKGVKRSSRLDHHVRFTLAARLEFQHDDRGQARTTVIADQAVELSNLAAGLVAWLLTLLSDAPAQLAAGGAWWAEYCRGWAEDLALMWQAATEPFEHFSLINQGVSQ